MNDACFLSGKCALPNNGDILRLQLMIFFKKLIINQHLFFIKPPNFI
jgi:hypothetical protein